MTAGCITSGACGPNTEGFDSTFLGSGYALSGDNKRVATLTADSTWSMTRTLLSKTAGKVYIECLLGGTVGGNTSVGLSNTNQVKDPANFPGGDTNSVAWFLGGGGHWYNNANIFAGPAVAAGDTIHLAVDWGAQKIWSGKNGTWNNSGNPDAGTGSITGWNPLVATTTTQLWFSVGGFDVNSIHTLPSNAAESQATPNITTFIRGWYP